MLQGGTPDTPQTPQTPLTPFTTSTPSTALTTLAAEGAPTHLNLSEEPLHARLHRRRKGGGGGGRGGGGGASGGGRAVVEEVVLVNSPLQLLHRSVLRVGAAAFRVQGIDAGRRGEGLRCEVLTLRAASGSNHNGESFCVTAQSNACKSEFHVEGQAEGRSYSMHQRSRGSEFPGF